MIVVHAMLLCSPQNANITDPYIEVIGIVQNATTVKMAACVNMGSDLGEVLFQQHSASVDS